MLLTVNLVAPGAALPPAATPVKVPRDATAAGLALTADGAVVHIALPDRARAEQRWIVDQVVRKVVALAPAERGALRVADGVPEDAALTIALDLHHRLKGAMEAPSAIAARVRSAGTLEDGFRAWVNEDPATRTSLAIARDVQAWAAGRDDVEVEVLDVDQLRERGLGLLLAVGQGSQVSPSRLVLARTTAQGAPLLLLGKGVTFDTGGINVKPYESYVSTMKNDMAGAALAFHLFRALVERDGASRPLALAIPTCENAVGAASMKPGALVKSYRGPTVRVDHTDAEGRLILADGLAYASEQYKPRQVMCFATLTTAALISYGPYATPVHFADDALQARLAAASEALGEDLHFFPARVWHAVANEDDEADLRNTARLPADASRGAGSRNAAHFLLPFTDAPLVHFDIFGTTWNWARDAPGAGYGATGAPLRTLLRAFELC